VSSGWAHTALSHRIFTGIGRRTLGKLIAELSGPWMKAAEGQLRERRGHERERAPGAGPGHDLRFQLPQAALAELYQVDGQLPAGELFDADGAPLASIRALAPKGDRRMSANPRANGGLLTRNLVLPGICSCGVGVPAPGAVDAEATWVLSAWLRDVLTADPGRFRMFGPDETQSNRLSHLFEVTDHVMVAESNPTDEFVSPDGRVMDVLSEHLCQGWLEGYLLTGRHGLFNNDEAFAHVIDSMFNQHAKWIARCRDIPWRRPIASLNYLLTSHVWRQDRKARNAVV
jgi:phosphoketolase